MPEEINSATHDETDLEEFFPNYPDGPILPSVGQDTDISTAATPSSSAASNREEFEAPPSYEAAMRGEN